MDIGQTDPKLSIIGPHVPLTWRQWLLVIALGSLCNPLVWLMVWILASAFYTPSYVTVENANLLYREAEALISKLRVSEEVRSENLPPTIRALHPMYVDKSAPHSLCILIDEAGAFGIPHGYLISDDPVEVKGFAAEDADMHIVPTNHPHIFAWRTVDNNR